MTKKPSLGEIKKTGAAADREAGFVPRLSDSGACLSWAIANLRSKSRGSGERN